MKARATIAGLPETKRQLLDASIKLMRAQGYNATTVDDICAAAGVTKGGFFHYFSNKQEIAAAALARFREGMATDSAEAPFRQLADPLDRVFGRLDFAVETAGGATRLTKGCLLGMFAQELAFTFPELRDNCQEAFARIARDFESDLADAKVLHAPKSGLDPKGLSQLYVSILQGSLMMAKTSGSNEVLAQNIGQFRLHLQNLFASYPSPAKALDKSRN